jgi:hypothetical protein
VVFGPVYVGMQCANKRYVSYLIRLSLAYVLYSIDGQDAVKKVRVKSEMY